MEEPCAAEIWKLRWENISWEEGTITVNRQMHNVGGQITLAKVKTMTVIREVIIPSFLQDYWYYIQKCL